ncbi:hypothetical protein D3C86_1985560 [compost metagenome]
MKQAARSARSAGTAAQAKVLVMEKDRPSVILLRIPGGICARVSGESSACGSLKSKAPPAAAPAVPGNTCVSFALK